MIESPDNEKVKLVRSLYAKKKRYEQRAFLIEGVRLVEEALATGARPHLVLYEPDLLARTPRGSSLLKKLGDHAFAVTERVLKSISDTVSPQGIVAVVSFPEEPAIVEGTTALVLDGLRDPGNAGTILRTAVAANVRAVLATSDTVDLFSPKVVRAGMGAHFRLNLFVDKRWAEIRRLLAGRGIFLAEARGGQPYYRVDWTRPSALIVSSEAHGASEEAERTGGQLVTIPMAPGAESLNAAVAAGIILFEAFRQQTMQSANRKG